MKYLKNLFSFVLPLLTVLFSFLIYIILNDVVANYENKISKDYSIVIVTHTPFDKESIGSVGGVDIESIETLDKDEIIKSFRNKLSPNSLDLLKKKLPFFYKIHLERYPTKSELELAIKELKTIKNIKRVESFQKDHTTIYSLLSMIQNIVIVIFFISLVFSFLIISKQIKIWFFEHAKRISIMQLHGASIIYSAKPMIKLALNSSFISLIIVSIALIIFTTNTGALIDKDLYEIIKIDFNIAFVIFKIAVLSFSISILAILGVLFKHRLS